MGSYKPAGILTHTLKAERKQTCRRIAEKKVQDAEKASIDRVVNTWLELRSFLESRGRPAAPEMVDLDQYLNHTQAPARALQALKWMNKNANQDLDLSNLAKKANKACS
jgi:transcriptional regulator GlxA family with amidase domain